MERSEEEGREAGGSEEEGSGAGGEESTGALSWHAGHLVGIGLRVWARVRVWLRVLSLRFKVELRVRR